MAVVPGTADRRQGYDEINLTRDYIAQRAPRQARGKFTTPQLGANSTRTVNITFPADTFTVPPVVMVSSSASRVTVSVGGITTTGAVLGLANWTPGIAGGPFEMSWLAVEV